MSVSGATVLVTGITSEVAKPVAISLAKENTVYGAARWRDAAARELFESHGITTVRADLVNADVSDLPQSVDYVLHFAVVKSQKWGVDLDGNVGGVLTLMERYHQAKAFFHCSTTAVYQPDGHTEFHEDSPLGDNHRAYFLPTYSISKIAAESAVRYAARRYDLPTTIARLNVPYGDGGGWPFIHLAMMEAGQDIAIHADAPSVFQPLHTDDIVATIPRLIEIASVPATIVNWGGDEKVSVEEWTAYLSELTGLPANLVVSENSLQSVELNLDKMHELVGHSTVHWKDGFRRMVEALRPDLLTG
ncbi:MAG: NAD(P)-dependent oxidoreductase [Frankiaceae bacterium]|nr:NAD(P)-dependent oxidoreductase [Frankiaceae bacterium]MBV9869607.1 NAD(P)-dependent oxidoreductase [Frankiaceae bacterium]